ncbi:MAG: DUF3817 domain-containing protein [Bacteroidetes bacterium]|nr:DUF3817 domain-containing protein [Bacteroidota bacterium]
MNNALINRLRKIGIAEGISFLILLLVAMPLKYMLGQPLAVTYVGWVHGALFVAYVGMAYYVKHECNWPFKLFIQAFIAAWLPLGTFWFDTTLKKQLN